MDKISEEEPNRSVFFSLFKIEGAFRCCPPDFLIRNVFDIGQSRVLSYSGYRIVKPDTKITFEPWPKGDFSIQHDEDLSLSLSLRLFAHQLRNVSCITVEGSSIFCKEPRCVSTVTEFRNQWCAYAFSSKLTKI